MALASITVNGLVATEAELFLPRVGTWHADLTVDTDDASQVSGPVIIAAEGLTLLGTTLRASAFAGFVHLRVVAGNGQLYRTLTKPKAYQGVTLKAVLLDILGAAGERLSNTSDASTVATYLQKWSTTSQGCIAAINSLLKPLSVGWRFLPDGTFWLGPESWPAIDSALDYVLIGQRQEFGRYDVAAEDASLLPGVTLNGQRIGYVQHTFHPEQFRTHAYFEA